MKRLLQFLFGLIILASGIYALRFTTPIVIDWLFYDGESTSYFTDFKFVLVVIVCYYGLSNMRKSFE